MSRSVVIEGPDNSGKSSLASLLAKELRLPLFKAGPPPQRDDLIRACCDYQLLWMLDRTCIFDRITPISHQCYQDIPEYWINYLNAKLVSMRPKILLIYCTGRFGFTRDDYESDEDDRLVRERDSLVRSRYDALMSRLTPEIEFTGDVDLTVKRIRGQL